MDQNNPIVKLCAEGMQAEGEGRPDDALTAFQQAWEASTDDYEACIAAHYLARHQPDDRETLRWNLEALERAERVSEERVREFYPSLLLNLGHSYETVGNIVEAHRHYELAVARLEVLPSTPYVEMIRRGVVQGLQRTES